MVAKSPIPTIENGRILIERLLTKMTMAEIKQCAHLPLPESMNDTIAEFNRLSIVAAIKHDDL